jgi:hypothetical protein
VQFRKDITKDAFIIEDWKSEKYVAVTENADMNLTTMMVKDVSTSEGKMVQVMVTSMLNPQTSFIHHCARCQRESDLQDFGGCL